MSRNLSRSIMVSVPASNVTFLDVRDAITTLMGQYITPVSLEWDKVASSRVARNIQSVSSLAVILFFPDIFATWARLPAHGPTHLFKHSARSSATLAHAGSDDKGKSGTSSHNSEYLCVCHAKNSSVHAS
jgi:hypothetical protein